MRADLAVPPFEQATPRQTRRRLNRLEAWLARTQARGDWPTPEAQMRVLRLRVAFEHAFTPDHADDLEGELRDLARDFPRRQVEPVSCHS